MKLTFIGTLHGDLTPNKELEEILGLHKPEQLLVEITQQDIDKETISSYPSEMISAYQWAKENNIPVLGFDSKTNVLVEGSTKKESEKLFIEQEKVIKKHNWKDFNKESYQKLLNIKSWNSVIDKKKWKLREEEMYQNIKKVHTHGKDSLVITGSGHIKFFKKKFPKAKFPLG